MALVRCSCVTTLVPRGAGRFEVSVTVLDPGCGYVVHRLGSVLDTDDARS
jgi:hypothetical protein